MCAQELLKLGSLLSQGIMMAGCLERKEEWTAVLMSCSKVPKLSGLMKYWAAASGMVGGVMLSDRWEFSLKKLQLDPGAERAVKVWRIKGREETLQTSRVNSWIEQASPQGARSQCLLAERFPTLAQWTWIHMKAFVCPRPLGSPCWSQTSWKKSPPKGCLCPYKQG